MFGLLLATACSWLVVQAIPAVAHSGAWIARPPSAVTGDDKALKALDAWLKLYRAGKIDYLSKDNIAKDSVAMKYGIAPKSGLGTPTWAGDLQLILENVAKLDTPEAAQALLDVATIGIEPGKYTRAMAPYEVRSVGERWAARLASAPAREELAKAARGEAKAEKARALALQIAGVRCLGQLKDKSFRTTLEQQLGDNDELVRLSAAEALAALGDEAAAMALIASLEGETADAVLSAVAQALRTLYGKHLPPAADPAPSGTPEPKEPAGEPGKPAAAPAAGDASGGPPESTRLAVRAAIKALGRATWRADLAMIRLLDEFRSIETVPALIAVLERFRDHPEQVQSGKLSGLLLHSAHELLVSMTGAVIPANQPEQWRELWERDKDKLEVTKKREPTGPVKTAASGFCGIPVQGTRVLFILDLSGSMDFPMTGDLDGSKAKGTRLLFAQRQLHRAMDSIAPNASFNLITFNKNPKAKLWSKEMVIASDKNRDRFRKYVDELEADGGTNLWSGLEEGLKLKSLVYGERYETNVDEVFLLSDGAPSIGDVLDPIEILRLVKESNRFAGMRINTIFISSPDPAERQPMPWMTITPEELMRRMAVESGGKFINL